MRPKAITFCHRGMLRGGRNQGGSPVPRYLEKAGFTVAIANDDPRLIPADGFLWLHGNAAWFPKICKSLRAIPPDRRPFVLTWHLEPLPPPRSSGLPYPMLSVREIAKVLLRDIRATDVYTNWFTLQRLNRTGIVNLFVVSAPGRKQFLQERGIHAHFVPVGYDIAMGYDLGTERDIDVLFLGALDVPRRNRLLRSLRAQGIDVTAVGDWKDPAFWGEQRTQLLNRTKILLNFPRTRAEYSGIRILLGLANKALVISEPMVDSTPYVSGKHFVMAPPEDMAHLIRHYLQHEKERREITDEGYRFALEEHTMENAVNRILEIAANSYKEGNHVGKTTADSGGAHLRA